MNRFKIIINLCLVIITNILRKITIFSSKTHLVRRVVLFLIFCKSPEGPALQRTGFSDLLLQSAALYVSWLCRAVPTTHEEMRVKQANNS